MKQTIVGLQVLRFVAAMLVAVMHLTQAISIHITGRGEGAYWGTGAVGVDIFFVISGFVMAVSTAALPASGPARFGAAWVFIKRRILRIVPVYWFYTVLKVALLIAAPALAARSSVDAGHLAASLAFIPALAPWHLVQPTLPVGWTLNFEMLFYVVFALALALGAPRVRFCLLAFTLLFAASHLAPGSVILGFYAQSMVFEFILGVAIAHALQRWGRAPVQLGAVLFVAGCVFTFGLGWDSTSDRLFPWGMGAAAIVLGTVWLEPIIRGAWPARPLAFLGDASYSIYLSHTFVVPACVIALKKIGVVDVPTVFLITSAAVIAAGALSYQYIETPLLAVARRLLFRSASLPYAHAAKPASD